MKAPSAYWFGRKRLGWGFGPRSWQGWVVTLVYGVLMVASRGVTRGSHAFHIASLIGLSAGFVIVFFL
jgi:hypothetical protein